MRVRIDYDECMGDGNCAKVCPEVFGYDDEELHGVVLQAEVPPELETRVRKAAKECAVRAIMIEG